MELSGFVPTFVVPYHKELRKGEIHCQPTDPKEKVEAMQWLIRNDLAEITLANRNGFTVRTLYP